MITYLHILYMTISYILVANDSSIKDCFGICNIVSHCSELIVESRIMTVYIIFIPLIY